FMRVADEVRASVRSSTSTSMSVSAMHDLVARLRAELSPAEQTLLILRIDRELSWKEVASVMAAEGEDVDPAALRKRFERLRVRIAERVAEEKAKRKK
ncbi:MAG: hypothetical protein JST92_25600, partial [Deltaproteobacteria bacterium]|nr:hypothetical protein [Deltaproteobacteria bacterium]